MKLRFVLLPLLAVGIGWLIYAQIDHMAEESRRDTAQRAELEAERILISDPARAVPALESRLRERVRVQGGLLVVTDSSALAVTYAFPLNVPWSVDCSILGLNANFGVGTAEVSINLTSAAMDEKPCSDISLALGRVMEALLRIP